MLLTIIIVNYNVKYFLEHCLFSVMAATKDIQAEILVVDNNSTDGSRAYLNDKFTSIKFYWLTENLGFAKANNLALKEAKGNFVLFLNPDTIVGEDGITNCINFLQTHPQAGAVGVRMINGSGQFLPESKRGKPTAIASFFKLVGLAKLFKHSATFASYYAGHIAEKQIAEVDVLAGAFMMLNKKAVHLTGGFDERYFMYGEDIDLSYSILKAGLKNYYLGSTTIIHFKGESTQKKSAAYNKYFFGAMLIFVQKHYPSKKFYSAAMGLMINIGGALHVFKNKMSVTKNINPPLFKNTCIVGTAAQLHLLQTVFTKKKMVFNNFVLNNSYPTNKVIINFISQLKAHNIILCQAPLSYNFIIDAIATIPNENQIYFYVPKAACMISSGNKNIQGQVILNL